MADQNPSPEENDPVADAFAELAAEEAASAENVEPSDETTQPQGDTQEAQSPEASAAQDAPAGGTDAAKDDDAEAMIEALLADVGAAVSDVNSGIMGEDAEPSSETAAPAQSSPQPQAQAPAPIPEGASPMDLPAFDQPIARPIPAELDMLADVNLNVKIELGRTSMLVEDVLELSDGAVVELDKLAGDPVDIYVNERRIARGEVLVLNDTFCVRINEIIEPEDIKTS